MAVWPSPASLFCSLSCSPAASLQFPSIPARVEARRIELITRRGCSIWYLNDAAAGQISIRNIKYVATVSKNNKRRKPRPSFREQVNEKWSLKVDSPRKSFPWQLQQSPDELKEEEQPLPLCSSNSSSSSRRRIDKVDWKDEAVKEDSVVYSEVSNHRRSLLLAPWVVQESKPAARPPLIGAYVTEFTEAESGNDEGSYALESKEEIASRKDSDVGFPAAELDHGDGSDGEIDIKCLEDKNAKTFESPLQYVGDCNDTEVLASNSSTSDEMAGAFDGKMRLKVRLAESVGETSFDKDQAKLERLESHVDSKILTGSVELPWQRKPGDKGVEDENCVRSSTMLADKLIPDHELKRLRNVSQRMLERISVGPEGITQAVLDAVHDKWKIEQVVKLKFEGLSSNNMKRVHEALERRTGGLVIWRSGGSVVLYRGLAYKLPCVQAYRETKENDTHMSKSIYSVNSDVVHTVPWNYATETTSPLMSKTSKYNEILSTEERLELKELNLLLDELGLRFYDWSGPEPLPVDADLLPSFVAGYKPPFRLLPYGAKHCLKNQQMTSLRRLARKTPPHFALGRNKDLQGLAQAMVKLWQTNAIAKIAIKRGILNTLNDKMAEELKRLTGGNLISRNKEYIVFYRGNDFLPLAVTETLEERKRLTELHQDEEEMVRKGCSINFKVKSCKVPSVAGTLSETVAAASCWGSQPTKEETAKMLKEAALEKHGSLIRYLEKKLELAKAKMKKAERALRKVQVYLDPAELPSDLETISDEERFLFRKMGLSMKPFLLVGRRNVFDGTIENMHLHWKFRELVKLIVKETNFALVKHIAISVEAESGGVLVSVDKTTKGYAIIIYRGKNYLRPQQMRPKNLLTRRQALARSIELQRREALKHHIRDLEEKIDLLKSGLEQMKSSKDIGDTLLHTRLSNGYFSDNEEGQVAAMSSIEREYMASFSETGNVTE